MLTMKQIDMLIRSGRAKLARRFLKAILDAGRRINDAAVLDMVERNNAAGVVAALNITLGHLAPISAGVEEQFRAVGSGELKEKPFARPGRTAMQVVFAPDNPRARTIVGNHNTDLLNSIVNSQTEAVQFFLQRGLLRGDGPRQTALDISGRLNRKTGRREGGVVGLNDQQAIWVANALTELETKQQTQFLSRKLMRHRVGPKKGALKKTPAVKRLLQAIHLNEEIDEADIRRLINQQSQDALLLRGETIARTETLWAVNAAREEAMRQRIDSGNIDEEDVVKQWRATLDDRTREEHAYLNGREANEQGEWSLGGVQARYPGDMRLPAGDRINCRCRVVYDVDFLAPAFGRIIEEE